MGSGLQFKKPRDPVQLKSIAPKRRCEFGTNRRNRPSKTARNPFSKSILAQTAFGMNIL
jgi:hypothetical protein